MKSFSNVLQPNFDEVWNNDFFLKGNWSKEFFKNSKPVVLELGCGKGEYAVGLAKIFPEKNFIGIDIKGARMHIGAEIALNNKLNNVAFLRTKVEFVESIFAKQEISEIWLTFPDPQMKSRRAKKRLTSSRFLTQRILTLISTSTYIMHSSRTRI